MLKSAITFGALLVNAILCAAFAEHADTFITTTAMLSAVAILTIKEDHHHG